MPFLGWKLPTTNTVSIVILLISSVWCLRTHAFIHWTSMYLFSTSSPPFASWSSHLQIVTVLAVIRGVVLMSRKLELQGRCFQTNSDLRNKLIRFSFSKVLPWLPSLFSFSLTLTEVLIRSWLERKKLEISSPGHSIPSLGYYSKGNTEYNWPLTRVWTVLAGPLIHESTCTWIFLFW